jgi:hypothetical protein
MAHFSHALAVSRRARGALFVAAALTILVSSCGKAQTSDGAGELGPAGAAGDGAEAGTAGAMAGSAGTAGNAEAAGSAGAAECPSGVPSAEELAATPRADINLELLALRHSTGIVADPEIYARIVRDVTAIRAADPSVAGIAYFPSQDGRTLSLDVDPATFSQMQSGEYHAWDCLNQSYVVTHLDLEAFDTIHLQNAFITFKGIYEISEVASQYASLPGVSSATYGGVGGDGATICLTREAQQWHYVFDQAGGDCPAGCTEHVYHHFSTTADGQVTSLGGLTTDDAVAAYASYAGCRGPDRPSAQ